MTLQALTVATDIRGRLAGSVIAALTLASIGSAVFTLPAAAAKAPVESVTDSVRSGPFGSAHAGKAPATRARTANPAVAPRAPPRACSACPRGQDERAKSPNSPAQARPCPRL